MARKCDGSMTEFQEPDGKACFLGRKEEGGGKAGGTLAEGPENERPFLKAAFAALPHSSHLALNARGARLLPNPSFCQSCFFSSEA